MVENPGHVVEISTLSIVLEIEIFPVADHIATSAVSDAMA